MPVTRTGRGAGVISLACAFVTFAHPAASRQHSTDPLDWIIQHVCADGADKPVPADPYDGCPAGTHERRLKVGEPLPYLRHDQPGKNGDHPHGFQRHDAYPLVDVRYGGIFSANDFDFGPYWEMELGEGDGFDVYRVANGYATGGGTRDGGTYSATFFGGDCKPFGGWVLFPASFLSSLAPGVEHDEAFPIHGIWWEHLGQPWPGICERGKGFVTNTLTTWSFEPDHVFGGLNGARPKKIDAIVSTHGLARPLKPELHTYHLERIYFTDLYGATRWEAWTDAREKRPSTDNCGDDTTLTFGGLEFTLTNCRDWSVIELLDPPRLPAPWPYPETNVLANWHFSGDGLAPWRVAGDQAQISLANSRAARDIQFAPKGPGLRYLRIDCSQKETDCGLSIYQDIPIREAESAKMIDYGFSGVIVDQGEGLVDVSLSQRDAKGDSVSEVSFTAHLTSEFKKRTAADSVYLASSVFLNRWSPVAIKTSAVSLRLTLSPRTRGKRYDILDTWVMPKV